LSTGLLLINQCIYSADYKKKYPLIVNYLATLVEKDIAGSTKIINALVTTNPNVKPETIKGMAVGNSCPMIEFVSQPGNWPVAFPGAAGYTDNSGCTIQLNSTYAEYAEKILESKASDEEKEIALFRLYSTLIHEFGHIIEDLGPTSGKNKNGHYLYDEIRGADENKYGKPGRQVQELIWITDNYKPETSIDANTPMAPSVGGIEVKLYQHGVAEEVVKVAEKTPEGKATLPTLPK